jgi:hypothetical protein
VKGAARRGDCGRPAVAQANASCVLALLDE